MSCFVGFGRLYIDKDGIPVEGNHIWMEKKIDKGTIKVTVPCIQLVVLNIFFRVYGSHLQLHL
jgi:hypothetical protein